MAMSTITDKRTVNAEALVFTPDVFTDIAPMANLHDYIDDRDAPAYLLSGLPDVDGLSRLNVAVLARHLAPILFPEG